MGGHRRRRCRRNRNGRLSGVLGIEQLRSMSADALRERGDQCGAAQRLTRMGAIAVDQTLAELTAGGGLVLRRCVLEATAHVLQLCVCVCVWENGSEMLQINWGPLLTSIRWDEELIAQDSTQNTTQELAEALVGLLGQTFSISILPILSKTFEKLIKIQLTNHLASNRLLLGEQSNHTFGTVSDKREVNILVLLDFRAFDNVKPL